MFSMQINVFAVIHMDVMVKVMKMIAVLVALDIQKIYVAEHGEIPFTEQNVSSSALRKMTIVNEI